MSPNDNPIDKAQSPELSMVVPVFNEEGSVGRLYDEVSAALNELHRTYEVIIIDDGSSDNSYAKLKEIHERDSRWQIIQFRRNFGQTAAMAAGFDAARGQTIITMDADLQNDPKDIGKLLDKMSEGYDIVSGWRVNRKEPLLLRRLPSMMANRLISRVTGTALHDYGCSLKVYDREVVKNIHLYGELHRFIPALASQVGVRVVEIPVNDRPRLEGKSKYGIMRTFKVILDLIAVTFLLSYFTRPLYIFGGGGLLISGIGGLMGLYLVVVKALYNVDIGERPLLLLAILLIILGVQMVSTGLVADMIMRTYHESQNKPIYFIREHLKSQEADE